MIGEDETIKNRAREAVRRAVRRGELIKPNTCESCAETFTSSFVVGHHHNGYDELHILDVQWLCRTCHGAVHGGVLNISAEVRRLTVTAYNESLTVEERSARGRHAALSVPVEQRIINAKKARAAVTKGYLDHLTHEERSARVRERIAREKPVTCSCGKVSRGAAIAQHRKRTKCP